jgi:hypothetical protein
MDLTPVPYIIRAMERALLLLLYGPLLAIFLISIASTFPAIYNVDLLNILLLLSWWPLVT